MSSFTSRPDSIPKAAPATNKHVNYTEGMILGVDDLTQEFVYLSGRDQWIARDLLGYGTIWGLRVHLEERNSQPEVVVDPGVAVSPRGQLIHVTPAQCARLNDWLALDKNRQDIFTRIGSPPNTLLKIYVTLCYRDCPTDDVPIPGEPCRTEEDTLAASRLTDDFKLELRLEPPNQCEEDILRAFVAWLRQIEITDSEGGFTAIDDFIAAIREAAPVETSPPSSARELVFRSPPAALRIRSGDTCEYLRAAFRVWATELRPRWRPSWLDEGRPCTANMPGEQNTAEPEECLLLAELDIPLVAELTGELRVQSREGVQINEERRPYLVHLRMLQEFLTCGPHGEGGGGGGIPDHGALAGLGDDDHSQYLLADGTRALTGDLSAGGHRISNLSPGAVPGHALVFQQAAGGDLSRTYPNPEVGGLRGRSISSDLLPTTTNEVLTWNGVSNVWEPKLHVLDDLADVSAPLPIPNGHVLTRQAGQWVPAAPSGGGGGGVTNHGALGGLGNDDHTQYLLVNGSRALTGDLSAGNHRIRDLSAGVVPGDAIVFRQGAGGDLGGEYPDPIVDGIQGRPVSSDQPQDRQALVWSDPGKQWEPGDVVQSPAGPYAIVAAGYVKVDGTPIGLTYGGSLSVTPQTPAGEYLISWDTYENPVSAPPPDPPRMYVVKGTVQSEGGRDGRQQPAVFEFVRFEKTGIRVRVMGVNNQPLPGPFPAGLFMFEISEIQRQG